VNPYSERDDGANTAMMDTPRGSLLAFFTLTYGVMWSFYVPVAAFGIPAHSPLGLLLLTLGAFAPSLVAVALTARGGGADAVRALVAPVLHWRVGARWYVFAAGYIVTIKLAVAVLHRSVADAWPRFGSEPWYLIPIAVAFATPFQAGEEIGWRGYALPRMARRLGLGPASLLLGLIWAGWHVPQFFIPQADTYQQSFIVYALQVTALSVAMAWLYARTGGSLLLVMLLHSAINNSKDIVPSASPDAHSMFGVTASLTAWLTVALLWICATYFLARMPGLNDEVRARA
jgi:uncharacterized protein